MSERIVMIGAGYWSQFQVEGWRDAGAPLAAIANRHVENAEALAQRYGVPRCYSDISAMLDAERPTLVDVCLPPVAQEPAVRAAIERGIPTICQKPFGIDLNQAEAMTALAEAAGVPLVVHENFRFAPWFRELRRCIDAGFFGRVHGIAFRLRPGDGQGPQAYLDRQPYFQQMPEFLVRETAVHFIDTFRFLMGEVRAVTARLRRLNPVIAGEDAGVLLFEFDDDRTGLFDGNRLNGHPATNLRRTMGEMWLEGERGVMRLDGEARLWWQPHGGAEAPTCLRRRRRHAAPSAAPAPRCRPMCWRTCARARRWRTAPATTWRTCTCRPPSTNRMPAAAGCRWPASTPTIPEGDRDEEDH